MYMYVYINIYIYGYPLWLEIKFKQSIACTRWLHQDKNVVDTTSKTYRAY